MDIKRAWAMPNKWTFTIPPIADLLSRYVGDGKGWIDPFAGENSPAEFTNDIIPSMPARFHLTAFEFCQMLEGEFNGALFDPPYSIHQVVEMYKGYGKRKQSAIILDLLADKIKPNGIGICCGWNSNGFGQSRRFELLEILMVAHGGGHNDTIITVERKIPNLFDPLKGKGE